MKKLILIPMVLASIIMTIRCDKSKKNELQSVLLENSWTQSFEEKAADNIDIFRPTDYKEFPIARYRQIFKFHANNVCDYLVLAENDAHYMDKGKWDYDEITNQIKVFNSESDIIYKFEVVELSADLLQLKSQN